MDQELKSITDDLRSTWEELKHRIEDGEAKTAEGYQGIDRLNDRLDALEVQSQKPGLANDHAVGDRETKALLDWTRTGVRPEGAKLVAIDQAGNQIESKALAIRDESLGGVLAPAEFVAQVVAGIVQYSPIRSIANVVQTSRTGIQFPKRTGNFGAAWTAELGTRTETLGRTYGLDEISTHELYARVLLSNWLLDDAAVDLETLITADMVAQFGVSEGAAFVSGNGVGKPEGILTNADVQANQVLNGGASFTNADGIIRLAFSVKEQYWPNAQFVCNRFTLRDLRMLKDSTGNYLWQPAAFGTHGVVDGTPATLYGYPYTVATDMPSAAANALTVAFGDFSKAYWIADRISMQMLRDPFSAAAVGEVILHARKRVGGQVVLPEAINVLKMA